MIIIWLSALAFANMVSVFTGPWLFLRIINATMSLLCASVVGYCLAKEGNNE